MRDAEFYRDRLAEIELVIAGTPPGGRVMEQYIKARDFCKRRIRECEYQERIAIILLSN